MCNGFRHWLLSFFIRYRLVREPEASVTSVIQPLELVCSPLSPEVIIISLWLSNAGKQRLSLEIWRSILQLNIRHHRLELRGVLDVRIQCLYSIDNLCLILVWALQFPRGTGIIKRLLLLRCLLQDPAVHLSSWAAAIFEPIHAMQVS